VNAGDVLLELKPTEVHANAQSTQSQVISLLAQKARLEAEEAGLTTIKTPTEFAGLPDEQKPEAEQAMNLQKQELATRLEPIVSQKAVLKQRQAELGEQITGYRKQVVATDDQSKSINAEMAGTKALADRGFASINRVRALERNAAGLTASRADLQANIAKSEQ